MPTATFAAPDGQRRAASRRAPRPCRGRSAGSRRRHGRSAGRRWSRSAGARGSRSGAISALWPPAAATSAMAHMATTVLPEPTSPWISRLIRSPAARSARISASARSWAPVKAKGRSARILAGDVAGGDPGGRLLAPLGLALGHGQLLGQQLVIGQAAVVRAGAARGRPRSRGLCRRASASRQAGNRSLREPGRVLPLRQLRRALQGLQREGAHAAGGQALGGRIDRPRARGSRRAFRGRPCSRGGPSGGRTRGPRPCRR